MIKKIQRPWIILLIITSLSHGQLFFNDGLYWDGWLIKGYLDSNDWLAIKETTSEMGLPVAGYIAWIPKLLGIHEYYKQISFLLIYIASIFLYKSSIRLGFLNRFESLFLSIIAVCYPAYQTTIEISTLNYLVFLAIFYFSSYLLIEGLFGKYRQYYFVIAIVCLILFLVSFNLNSLLTYYYSLIILIAIKIQNAENSINSEGNLKKLTIFFVLPILFWAFRSLITPPNGLYGNYHSINFSLINSIVLIKEFIRISIFDQILNSFRLLSSYIIILLINIAIIYYIYNNFYIKKFTENHVSEPLFRSSNNFWLTIFSLLILFNAIFPYVAVGIGPSFEGFSTRHNLLIAVPVGLLFLIIFRYYSSIYSELRYKSKLSYKRTQLVIIFTLIFSFILACNNFYIRWQARAIKDHALIQALSNNNDISFNSIFWIDDRMILGPENRYDYYEYSSMFKKIWGGQGRIGIPINDYEADKNLLFKKNKYHLIHRYNLKDLNINGNEIFIKIIPLTNLSEFQLVKNYFKAKFSSHLSGTRDVSEFLRKILIIEIYTSREQIIN